MYKKKLKQLTIWNKSSILQDSNAYYSKLFGRTHLHTNPQVGQKWSKDIMPLPLH